MVEFQTIDQTIGGTPLVRLQRQATGTNTLLVKLEGNNPAGSVKDRPALSMVAEAERRGRIRPGDTLIEATSGNTGIALAMVAAMRGYRMILIMPADASAERRSVMTAYGAQVMLTPKERGMEGAIDRARSMERAGDGIILDQFANPDNPQSHYRSTGPEIWADTDGRVTHLVCSMGTTGTIMGTGRYLKEMHDKVCIVGVQPEEGSSIPGIRKWPEEYLPAIYDATAVDRLISVSRLQAEETTRRMAREEGIFCGISSGGCISAALSLCNEINDGLIVAIAADRGDRYLSTGVFPTETRRE